MVTDQEKESVSPVDRPGAQQEYARTSQFVRVDQGHPIPFGTSRAESRTVAYLSAMQTPRRWASSCQTFGAVLGAVLGAALLASCSAPVAPTAAPSDPACVAALTSGVRVTITTGVSTWAILPRSTDICISQALDSNYVARASGVAPTGKLLLFLPTTGATPFYYQLILNEAAKAGYHAIALAYPDQQFLSTLCAAQPGTCYGDTRLEVLTGQAVSSVVTVDRANSIENRAIRLLRAMKILEPAGNWGQYLVGDSAVRWSSVSIAGHSEGGGEALFIAQRYPVWRATAYASYGDALPNNGGPAPWLLKSFATPSNRLFGLISVFDEVVGPLLAFSGWSAIGMSGDVVDVDVAPPPYGTSQRFFTNLAPANRLLAASPNHNLVVLDLNTPKTGAAQTPTLATVWRALSFP